MATIPAIGFQRRLGLFNTCSTRPDSDQVPLSSVCFAFCQGRFHPTFNHWDPVQCRALPTPFQPDVISVLEPLGILIPFRGEWRRRPVAPLITRWRVVSTFIGTSGR